MLSSLIAYRCNISVADSDHCERDKIIGVDILNWPGLVVNLAFGHPCGSALRLGNEHPNTGEVMGDKQMNDKKLEELHV